MNSNMQFDMPLRVGLVNALNRPPVEAQMAAARASLSDQDELVVIASEDLDQGHAKDIDLLIIANPCGPTPLAGIVAELGIPTMAMAPHRGFHPYHAAFYREVEERAGLLLPDQLPQSIEASVAAVRCRRALASMKLIVADGQAKSFATERMTQFARACHRKLGIEIVIRSTEELRQKAASYDEQTVTKQLQNWHENLMDGPGEMDEAHMRQVVRLYLAERAMLQEEQAVGFTVHDIRDFLQAEPRQIMPNVTYGALVWDGYLACEEADIEILTTELLLYAALGEHPTMSNVYFAFRDRLGSVQTFDDYTEEMELQDCRQCFEDNHLTVSHFSTAGVLPPNMMQEDRYRVRETLPSWPGQSMVWATPRKGPVALARIGPDAAKIHCVAGDIDELGFGEQYGWYRGRWFVRLPDTQRFADQMLGHHYAIGPKPGNLQTLRILCETLFQMQWMD